MPAVAARLQSVTLRFDLRTGDTVMGQVRPPKDSERYFALLKVNRQPSEAQIREGLSPNLCRCGTYNRVIKAVQRAAQYMRSAAVDATPGTGRT
mgnify:CR=1 FL=1